MNSGFSRLAVPDSQTPAENADDFYIVGIRASAGGISIDQLEACGTTPRKLDQERVWLTSYYPVNLLDGERRIGAVVVLKPILAGRMLQLLR